MTPDFVLVTDASAEIGMGHAVRMTALASALVKRGRSVVIATDSLPYIAERLRLPCMVRETGRRCTVRGRVTVIDSPACASLDRSDDSPVVVFNDYGPPLPWLADVVVNPHLNAAGHDYGDVDTLRGPDWLPLREGFEVVGASLLSAVRLDCYPKRTRPAWVIAGEPITKTVPLAGFTAVNANKWYTNPVVAMATCDVAVVPASTVAYECMALGVPCLVYVPTPKHDRIAIAMVAQGCALPYSPESLKRLADDATERERLRQAGMTAVDGRGADRLAGTLETML